MIEVNEGVTDISIAWMQLKSSSTVYCLCIVCIIYVWYSGCYFGFWILDSVYSLFLFLEISAGMHQAAGTEDREPEHRRSKT